MKNEDLRSLEIERKREEKYEQDKKDKDQRRSFRVYPPLNSVKEIAIWFKSFKVAKQMSLCELGMPHMVSLRKEKRIILEDLSGMGLCMSLDRKALSMNGIKRISGSLIVYISLAKKGNGKGKSEDFCVLVGLQLTSAKTHVSRIDIRGKIIMQARADLANNMLIFYNVEKGGVKEINAAREELSRMSRKEIERLVRKVDMEKLLVEILSDDETQAQNKKK